MSEITNQQEPINPPSPKDFGGLTVIGLTQTQAYCYDLVAKGQGMSVGNIAKHLGVNRTSLYKSIKDLHAKGFLTEWHLTSPTIYRAVPLSLALVSYADYQRRQVKELIVLQQQLRS